MTDRLVAELDVDVPFHDVDVMEVVWHGHYLKYFEVVRTRLLQQLQYDYPEMRASGFLWPIVDCRLKFVRPARYGQRLHLRAQVAEYEFRLKIDYRITDAATGECLTKGETIQVAVKQDSGELQYASPPALLERIKS